VTVPALLGMARALQGNYVTCRKAFWTLCKPQRDPWTDDHMKWEELKALEGTEGKFNLSLFQVVSQQWLDKNNDC